MRLNLEKEPSHNVNWLRERPIAHRALHDKSRSIYENTLSAVRAAIDKNLPIEFDLQVSSDGVPMVFHDFELNRMTGAEGKIRETPCEVLKTLSIMDTEDRIPTLEELLQLVSGRVGLVIELKGLFGEDEGFVQSVAELLAGYQGQAVIMSFNHHILLDARRYAPELPLGLTAEGDDRKYDVHREICELCNVEFVSYHLDGLETRFAKEFRNTGRPLITWTIRNREQLEYCARYSDQPTFEGFSI